jgi:hypothetical protein
MHLGQFKGSPRGGEQITPQLRILGHHRDKRYDGLRAWAHHVVDVMFCVIYKSQHVEKNGDTAVGRAIRGSAGLLAVGVE